MGQTVELLENALRAWEDCCLIDEARIRTGIEAGRYKPQDLQGPMKHWRELRNHLLMIKGNDFDVARFFLEQRDHPSTILLTGAQDTFGALPLQLASWTVSSRRVFHLSTEMIQRFLAADYTNYRWSDLLWPFDSFAMELELPVLLKDGNGDMLELPFMLVTSFYGVTREHSYAEKDGFEIGLFITGKNGEKYPTEFIPTDERERLDEDVRHKRWNKVNSRLRRFSDVIQKLTEGNKLRLPAGNRVPMAGRKEERITEGSTVTKLIAGLCLYLEALPAGTVENYPWHQSVPIKARREVRKVITDGEQVCRVNDFHVISPDAMTLFPETLRTGPAYSVTPHWRRAHYRRPKGQGKNPDAPRTVKIEAAFIHKDQMPPGAVPGGAKSTVR